MLIKKVKDNIEKQAPEVFYKKTTFKHFAKVTRIHLCWSLFLIKLQTEDCNFIKKEILAQVFSFEFCKIFKYTIFYRTTPGDWFSTFFFGKLNRDYLFG